MIISVNKILSEEEIKDAICSEMATKGWTANRDSIKFVTDPGRDTFNRVSVEIATKVEPFELNL